LSPTSKGGPSFLKSYITDRWVAAINTNSFVTCASLFKVALVSLTYLSAMCFCLLSNPQVINDHDPYIFMANRITNFQNCIPFVSRNRNHMIFFIIFRIPVGGNFPNGGQPTMSIYQGQQFQ